jgi:hypothetical protein
VALSPAGARAALHSHAFRAECGASPDLKSQSSTTIKSTAKVNSSQHYVASVMRIPPSMLNLIPSPVRVFLPAPSLLTTSREHKLSTVAAPSLQIFVSLR